MLCKLHIIRPHESLGSKNSHSQRTPRIGGAQLTSARTPTSSPLPRQGAPTGRATPTHPPVCAAPAWATPSGHRSHPAGQSFGPQGFTQGRMSGGSRREAAGVVLVAPGPLSQPHTCLECLWDTHWEAGGTILQMRTLGPCGGGALATVRCWTGGPLADVLARGGWGPAPAGRQGSCRSPGCWG